jgi:hypothetical protein
MEIKKIEVKYFEGNKESNLHIPSEYITEKRSNTQKLPLLFYSRSRSMVIEHVETVKSLIHRI